MAKFEPLEPKRYIQPRQWGDDWDEVNGVLLPLIPIGTRVLVQESFWWSVGQVVAIERYRNPSTAEEYTRYAVALGGGTERYRREVLTPIDTTTPEGLETFLDA